jgi:hypothetical protein
VAMTYLSSTHKSINQDREKEKHCPLRNIVGALLKVQINTPNYSSHNKIADNVAYRDSDIVSKSLEASYKT